MFDQLRVIPINEEKQKQPKDYYDRPCKRVFRRSRGWTTIVVATPAVKPAIVSTTGCGSDRLRFIVALHVWHDKHEVVVRDLGLGNPQPIDLASRAATWYSTVDDDLNVNAVPISLHSSQRLHYVM